MARLRAFLALVAALSAVVALAGIAEAATPQSGSTSTSPQTARWSDRGSDRSSNDHGEHRGREHWRNARGGQERNERKARHEAPPDQTVTCTLKVPAQPLTAAGLATPYVLAHGCSMREDGQRAFVEATISRPDGTLAVYHPLVVDQGKQPAAAPVAPALPAGSTVGVWFGFNGDVLRLAGPGAHSCVNGTPGSPFGQFAYCGAPAFFAAAANAAVPPLGTTTQGRPCPTVRDFSVVDQDQSDNLVTTYVLTPDGRTAQANAANAALGAPITNGSDNGLLDRNIDPALGCTPFMAESLDDPGTQVPSLALNELQADAQQGPPQALIPSNDPFAQVRGKPSLAKVALYRLGVGQPVGVSADGAAYCANLATVGLPRIQAERPLTQAAASPEAGTGLYDFLIARYQATLQNLGCAGAASAGHSSHH